MVTWLQTAVHHDWFLFWRSTRLEVCRMAYKGTTECQHIMYYKIVIVNTVFQKTSSYLFLIPGISTVKGFQHMFQMSWRLLLPILSFMIFTMMMITILYNRKCFSSLHIWKSDNNFTEHALFYSAIRMKRLVTSKINLL